MEQKEERGCLNLRRTINKLEIKISMCICIFKHGCLCTHSQNSTCVLYKKMHIYIRHTYKSGYSCESVFVYACDLLLAPLTPTH